MSGIDRPERPQTPMHPGDRERDAEHASRVGSRAFAGGVIGVVVGGIVGAVCGAVFADGDGAIIVWAIVGVIGLGGLGLYVGGMAGLESPDPTTEPMQTESPLGEPALKVDEVPRATSDRDNPEPSLEDPASGVEYPPPQEEWADPGARPSPPKIER